MKKVLLIILFSLVTAMLFCERYEHTFAIIPTLSLPSTVIIVLLIFYPPYPDIDVLAGVISF